MKPGITPYNRNSRLGLKLLTVNPCNQFIIEGLIRWKIRVEKHGLNQFYTYNLAIQSVRKYPLPILCYDQLKFMEGFGKFFCASVTRLVRNHYRRGRLSTREEKQADDIEHQQGLRRQMKKMRNNMRKNGEDDEQENSNQNQSQYSQFNDNFQSQFEDPYEQGQSINDNQQSENSEYSNASQRSSKSYKPKPGCDTYKMLKAMGAILEQRAKDPNYATNPKPLSRAEINLKLYDWKEDKLRSWLKFCEKLQESGYIKIEKDTDFIQLTTKGRDFLTEELSGGKQSQQNNNNVIKIFRKEQLKPGENSDKLCLLVNTKGSFKSQQSFVNSLTEQRYKIKQLQFELGSFIFMLETKILDLMILRFKLDNFDTQQFNGTILRARNSECGHIIIIFEFPQEKNKKLAINKDQLAALVSKCRASQFRVVKFVGSSQSVKFIHFLTDSIIEKIKASEKNAKLFLLGTFDFYNQKNKKLLPVVLKQVNKNFLKCIPCINRSTVQGIVQIFPTLKIMHDQLLRLLTYEQKVNFINWLISKYSPKKGLNMLIVDLLLSETYELTDETDIA